MATKVDHLAREIDSFNDGRYKTNTEKLTICVIFKRLESIISGIDVILQDKLCNVWFFFVPASTQNALS